MGAGSRIPSERLKPTAICYVTIIAETIQNTLVVPASALSLFDEGGQEGDGGGE